MITEGGEAPTEPHACFGACSVPDCPGGIGRSQALAPLIGVGALVSSIQELVRAERRFKREGGPP